LIPPGRADNPQREATKRNGVSNRRRAQWDLMPGGKCKEVV
jgi:hypothetical protein